MTTNGLPRIEIVDEDPPPGWAEAAQVGIDALEAGDSAIACPGCGQQRTGGPLDYCDDCEFGNLATGWFHYCGKPGCYCRNIPGSYRPGVLTVFAKAFAACPAEYGRSSIERKTFMLRALVDAGILTAADLHVDIQLEEDRPHA